MPKFLCRALRRLFPLQSKPVTLPTEGEARALGDQLISRGKRAVIYPAAHGYTVREVAA